MPELLTWEDMMKVEIIGQPVWDAERRRWYLVVDSALDWESWLEMVDDCGKIHHLIEHDFKDWKLCRKDHKDDQD